MICSISKKCNVRTMCSTVGRRINIKCYSKVFCHIDNGLADSYSSNLSPLFIDNCFDFLSSLGSDSAEGFIVANSVFSKCSASVRTRKYSASSTRFKPNMDLPIPSRLYNQKDSRFIHMPLRNSFKRKTVVKQTDSDKSALNEIVIKGFHKKGFAYRSNPSVSAYASSLFRSRNTSAFLLFTLTHSLLHNTDMYSVYRRNLLIISLNSVPLHLAFDYTDSSFAESVLATDISYFCLFNK